MAAPGSLRQNDHALYFDSRHQNPNVGRELAISTLRFCGSARSSPAYSECSCTAFFLPRLLRNSVRKLNHGRPRARTKRNQYFAGHSRFIATGCIRLLDCDFEAQPGVEVRLIILRSVDFSYYHGLCLHSDFLLTA